MGRRTLSLRREPLTELAAGDLIGVVGAAGSLPTSCPLPATGDLSRKLGCEGTYDCPTWTC